MGGQELYRFLATKVAALGFGLIANHPIVDGNKWVGHAARNTMLILNGAELRARLEEAEAMILHVASGPASREQLVAWVGAHTVPATS